MLFLLFRLGKDRYALPAREVVEVLPMLEVKQIPQAPLAVRGVFDFRGRPQFNFGSWRDARPAAEVHFGTGDVLSITVFETQAGGLFIPFRDATNGSETYGAGRYLLDGVPVESMNVTSARLIICSILLGTVE